MSKRIKHKPRCNRVKHLDLTHKLSREDTKAIAMMALHETLIIDHLSFATPSQQKILKGMMNLLNQLNKTYAGNVEDHLIEYADRYLCKVQNALDTFFDEMSAEDVNFMAAVKEQWLGPEKPKDNQ